MYRHHHNDRTPTAEQERTSAPTYITLFASRTCNDNENVTVSLDARHFWLRDSQGIHAPPKGSDSPGERVFGSCLSLSVKPKG